MHLMKKIAVILFGSPGSGKGMQADLLADKYTLIHFDSGKVLRSILHDPAAQKDPVLKRELALNSTGILNTPSWVLGMFKKRTRAISGSGFGIVYSGSPRTIYEGEGLMPVLEKEYGKRNIFVFHLDVPLAAAAARNKVRLVCTTCRRPLLVQYYPVKNPKHCPVCGGVLKRRIDDDPEKFRIRSKEYSTRTKPVMALLKKRGYRIVKVDGTPAPYLVFQKIAKIIEA